MSGFGQVDRSAIPTFAEGLRHGGGLIWIKNLLSSSGPMYFNDLRGSVARDGVASGVLYAVPG